MTTHIVQEGDSLSKIAHQYKVPLERIWNDPQNRQLRELRKHPDVLYPGDSVFIPPRKIKTFSRSTGQSHVFIKRTPKAELKLRIFLNGQPCGNTPCTLDSALQQPEQTTDDQGQVIFAIGPDLDQAELTVQIPPDAPSHRSADDSREEPHILKLQIGHLDPPDTLTGFKARLTAIGFHCLPVNDELDKRTQNVIRRFQKAFGYDEKEINGLDDDKTKKLAEQLYEQSQSWPHTLTDEDKLCRNENIPGYYVASNHWNLIDLINGPRVTIDGHMHINSGRCCPLPLTWSKFPVPVFFDHARPRRTYIEGVGGWLAKKADSSLKGVRTLLHDKSRIFSNYANKTIDITEQAVSRLTINVAEALVQLHYIQTKALQEANTAAAEGAGIIFDEMGREIDKGANFFDKVARIYRRISQKLRGIGEDDAPESAEVMDGTLGVSARIVAMVMDIMMQLADETAELAADVVDTKAREAELTAWVEKQFAQACYKAAESMIPLSDDLNRAMDMVHDHAAGLIRYVATQLAGLFGMESKAARIMVKNFQNKIQKTELSIKKIEDQMSARGEFITCSANSTHTNGLQAVENNRKVCKQLPVPKDSDHLNMMMVMPMDMDFGHIDGYEGKQIYDKEEVRHHASLKIPPLRPFFPLASPYIEVPIPVVLPPGADPKSPEYRDYFDIREEKGPFYFFYRRHGKNGRYKKLIWLEKEEFKLFKKYDDQIKGTIAAVAERPWELLPFYKYDPRRWSKDKSHKRETEIFDNETWEKYPQAWDQPFKDYFNNPSERLFPGIKMYTALGFRPLDPYLKHQNDFYEKCVEEKLPIICHGSPAGMYSYERPLYAIYDAEKAAEKSGRKIKKEIEALKKETERKMEDHNVDVKKVDWKDYYYCEHFVSPRAWDKVMKKHGELRLCLAHFGGDENHYTTWREKDDWNKDGDNWDHEMIRMAKEYDNFYIDISYFLMKKYAKQFKRVIEDPNNRHLWDKIIFGTDWWMIGLDAMNYGQFVNEAKTILDEIDPELWYRFSWINPIRFFRIKENKDAIAKGLEAAASNLDDKKKKAVMKVIKKYSIIIEKLEIK